MQSNSAAPAKKVIQFGVQLTTPPMPHSVRKRAGYLIRALQEGELLSLPTSRPMPSIGPRCHELRINAADGIWRVVYRIDADAIIVVHAFFKTTMQTPIPVIRTCQSRLQKYDERAP